MTKVKSSFDFALLLLIFISSFLSWAFILLLFKLFFSSKLTKSLFITGEISSLFFPLGGYKLLITKSSWIFLFNPSESSYKSLKGFAEIGLTIPGL